MVNDKTISDIKVGIILIPPTEYLPSEKARLLTAFEETLTLPPLSGKEYTKLVFSVITEKGVRIFKALGDLE